jgi:adenylyltransferase/sulfurtransferase
MEAIKILSGHRADVQRSLMVFDLWENSVRQIKLAGLRESSECPTCVGRKFEWLDGGRGAHTAVLCGRNAVQIGGEPGTKTSLDALAIKLAAVGTVTRNAFLLRAAIGEYVLTVFPDGRAIIGGTDDIATARTVYAKYVGS